MKKVLVLCLMLTVIISNINVSFASNNSIGYSETDDEILAAEKHVKSMIKNAEKEFERDIKENNGRVVETNNLADLSVAKTIEYLNNQNQPYDKEFAEICKQIEEIKKGNKGSVLSTIKSVNKKAGLKEKDSFVSISLGTDVYAISYSTWSNMTLSEKALCVIYPSQALRVNSCSKLAYEYTSDKFGGNGLGDESDGYRHAIWNALMKARIGNTLARSFATAHEDKTQDELNELANDGYYEYEHKVMDLHNNEEGRDCVEWYEAYPFLSDSTIKSRVTAKLTNTSSGIIWLH